MNNSFTILTFLKMIKKNIILFLSVFILVTAIGIITGSVLYTNSYTVNVTCSLTITENKNAEGSGVDYTTQYYDNAASFIKDTALLEEVADTYGIKLKDIQSSLSYSRTYGIINITYTTDTKNTLGRDILMTIITNWQSFINGRSFSGIIGNCSIILGPVTQTDLTSTLLIFIAAFAVVGLVLGIAGAAIKSFYSKTIIDPSFIANVINVPLVCKIKKNANNDTSYKCLLLEAARNNNKVIGFATNRGTYKKELVESFITVLAKSGYSVKLIDLSLEIDKESKELVGSVFNFKSDNPISTKIEEYKKNYDFVIINSPDEFNDIKFAVNKFSDLTIMDIEINKTIRKELRNDLSIMEKDNKNIIGVIVE